MYLEPFVKQVNAAITSVAPNKEPFVIALAAILIAYVLKEVKGSGFVVWILFSVLVYCTLKYVGIG